MRHSAVLFVLLAGCSAGGKAVVTGTVMLDGKPLASGLIRFVPLDGAAAASSAPINDGRFHVEAHVGQSRVEITSPKVVGSVKVYNTPDSPVRQKLVEAIPVIYNWRSGLLCDVRPGEQEVTYALRSK
jgi:hypothetical protein